MTTPAEVIGRNVRATREHRGLTAEAFAEKVGEILGNVWPRQTVYLLEAGGRRLAAEEVVTMAIVLDVSVADLFTPQMDVDELEVGKQSFPRERLLTLGERNASIYEIAQHTLALRRSFNDLTDFIGSQRIVINNIDRALLGKPAEYEPPKPPPGPGLRGTFYRAREYERVQEWYEGVAEGKVGRVRPDGSLIDPEGRLTDQAGDNE
jgi:transcriptional regulator with XRE-family HTH domain